MAEMQSQNQAMAAQTQAQNQAMQAIAGKVGGAPSDNQVGAGRGGNQSYVSISMYLKRTSQSPSI